MVSHECCWLNSNLFEGSSYIDFSFDLDLDLDPKLGSRSNAGHIPKIKALGRMVLICSNVGMENISNSVLANTKGKEKNKGNPYKPNKAKALPLAQLIPMHCSRV